MAPRPATKSDLAPGASTAGAETPPRTWGVGTPEHTPVGLVHAQRGPKAAGRGGQPPPHAAGAHTQARLAGLVLGVGSAGPFGAGTVAESSAGGFGGTVLPLSDPMWAPFAPEESPVAAVAR